jgi:hypothetical protein
VDGSIAQGRSNDGWAARSIETPENRRWAIAVGLAIVAIAVVVYVASNPLRYNFYDHFTWQASAWLEGQAGIRYPVPASADSVGNDYFLDVMPVLDANGAPTGHALIPFPPLPAVVLLPFVAIWGLATNAQLIAAVIGAIDVGLAWWMLGRLRIRLSYQVATTVFFAFGTVLWYAAMLGSTWFLAHVVAVGLTLLALGIAIGADPEAVREAFEGATGRQVGAGLRSWQIWSSGHGVLTFINGRQFLAGFLLGLAATARLTVIFGVPFLVLVGGGGSLVRRGVSAGLGAAVPLLGLALYNLATTGHIFHPAYEYLYQIEAYGYPDLRYDPSWAIEDLRYVPQNLALMLGGPPDLLPACPPGAERGLFNNVCPLIVPRSLGMSILLTSPGWLLAIPALLRFGRDRLATGAAIAVFLIAFINLMHFSQGWVQFGYRFSNDFAPFALLLVALGLVRLGRVGWRGGLLIGASVAINLWGVVWGLVLGW